MPTYGRNPTPQPYQYEPVSTPLTPQAQGEGEGYRSVLRQAPRAGSAPVNQQRAQRAGYEAAPASFAPAANLFMEAEWDEEEAYDEAEGYEEEWGQGYAPEWGDLSTPSTTNQRMAVVLIVVMLLVLVGTGGLWWVGWGSQITAVVSENSSQLNNAVAPLPPASEVVAPDPATTTAQIIASGQLSPAFAPEVLFWAPKIIEWAGQWDLDPNLVATVMQIESCGDPHAISSAGARGLFQVMPFHFEEGEDMLDPDTNAYRGMSYLSLGLSLRNGDANLAMAGYNGGHGTVPKGWANWPNEMQRYYRWGSGIYGEVTAGHSQSETLGQWLAAGGASLCRQAGERQVTLGLRSE